MPLFPARGEKVGIRGSFRERGSRKLPLTRRAMRADLSPHAG
jgi:hypothetical protein